MWPTNANASSMDSSDYAVVGGISTENNLVYIVVDKSTGEVIFSERVYYSALGTHDGFGGIKFSHRYWQLTN